MRREERSLLRLMHPAELDVRAGSRIQHREREFLFRFAGAGVDEHQLRRIAVLRHEHAVKADRLDGMNLCALRRVQVPDDLLVRRDFARADFAAENDVAVGKHRGVAQFLKRDVGSIGIIDRNRIGPRHLAVADDENGLVTVATIIPLAGVKKRMLRQSLAGQHGGRVGNGVGRRGGCCGNRRICGRIGGTTFQSSGRAEREENGQVDNFHGVDVLWW